MEPWLFPDPLGMFASLGKVQSTWMSYGPELMSRLVRLSEDSLAIVHEEIRDMIEAGGALGSTDGGQASDPVEMLRKNAAFARKNHALLCRWLRELVAATPGVEAADRDRSLFWAEQMLCALAPANYFWGNPGAVQRYLETGGRSLREGIRNWLEDLRRRDSLVRLVDESAFRVGDNLAATPGAVVFRNELVEVIQYEPVTPSTYRIPLVLIQPWINKFYIFDLSPQKSFVRYLIGKGFTVFITSWRNPDASLRSIAFEDYLFKGILAAIEVARSVCGRGVHVAGYCIGGTALAVLMAWLNHRYRHPDEMPVVDWTLLASLTDFSKPGLLGVFMNKDALRTIESLTAAEGFLDGRFIGLAFRLLNADGLIWRNVVNNYLFGQAPPRSDMLFWNSDCTRLPEAMVSFFLKTFYFRNEMTKPDALRIRDQPIGLNRIRQPGYIVGALVDHICPWPGTFLTCGRLKCPTRYVLTSEGHITGIVNPPSPRSRKKYWVGEGGTSGSAEEWLQGRPDRQGSWWDDWTHWLAGRSNELGAPPSLGNAYYPPLTRAPGTYVHER